MLFLGAADMSEERGPDPILVVDDDPSVRRTVSTLLQRHGYEVMAAADVPTAIALAQQTCFGCAVVDWSLQLQSGLAILQELRTTQPDCIRILMTGRSRSDIYVEALRDGGVTDIVKKPFSIYELLSTVDRARRSRRTSLDSETARFDRERSELEDALTNHLGMALQPIVDDGLAGPLRDRRVVAYEALLRSTSPTLGTPLAMFAAAERFDRVTELGSRAMALAAERLSWLPDGVQLFVNLHPAQLVERTRLEADLKAFAGHERRVVFEITERMPLEDVVFSIRTVDMVRSKGFAIAVDDLGGGYSSLAMVADVEPAYLKLDMSVVRDLDRAPRRQKLVQLLQRFGDAENTKIIAEGVESTAELQALRECRVRLMQGHWFAAASESRGIVVH